VLCEGNHCRSPIAEGLFRAALPALRIESAGLAAKEGCPPHAEALRLMAGQGIDISACRSRQVTPALALEAELILVMDQAQKDWCGALAPSARGRIQLLGCWLPPGQREIPDPFGGEPEVFAVAFDLIQRSVAAWREHLGLVP
jgi:protein-tyrosine phosphatase